MSQLVKVQFDEDNPRQYTYNWAGFVPLRVGDRVVVPPSWASPEPKHATVTDTTSDYTGPVKDIVGVIVNRQTGETYVPVVDAPHPAGW